MPGMVSGLRLSNAFWFCTLLCNRSRTHSHMASCWLNLFGKSGTGLCQLNRGFRPNCHPEPPPYYRSLIQVCQGVYLKVALVVGVRIPQLRFHHPHTFLEDLTLKTHEGVKIFNHSSQWWPLAQAGRAKHLHQKCSRHFLQMSGAGCILQLWNRNKLTGT